MSLNGLDNPTVIEAYQIALTEAGGWYVPSFESKSLLNTKILIVASFHLGFFCGTSQGMKWLSMSGGQGAFPTYGTQSRTMKNAPRSMGSYNIVEERSCSAISLRICPDLYEVCLSFGYPYIHAANTIANSL
jgi:hypothetical protein